MLCAYCGELEFNVLHHDTSLNTPIKPLAFEAGCSCEESGRCVVCIEQAVDYADHMRDAAKEGQ